MSAEPIDGAAPTTHDDARPSHHLVRPQKQHLTFDGSWSVAVDDVRQPLITKHFQLQQYMGMGVKLPRHYQSRIVLVGTGHVVARAAHVEALISHEWSLVRTAERLLEQLADELKSDKQRQRWLLRYFAEMHRAQTTTKKEMRPATPPTTTSTTALTSTTTTTTAVSTTTTAAATTATAPTTAASPTAATANMTPPVSAAVDDDYFDTDDDDDDDDNNDQAHPATPGEVCATTDSTTAAAAAAASRRAAALATAAATAPPAAAPPAAASATTATAEQPQLRGGGNEVGEPNAVIAKLSKTTFGAWLLSLPFVQRVRAAFSAPFPSKEQRTLKANVAGCVALFVLHVIMRYASFDLFLVMLAVVLSQWVRLINNRVAALRWILRKRMRENRGAAKYKIRTFFGGSGGGGGGGGG
eukprot:CAMPEP_0198330756 /NCGR_PEP_ID=MMETSP1450-20131203/17141_1 /TAXON_ID=753684 ORGANISM="Madagascaria erythrocladiodes, Strain CCMP3234" /NCGR_SAMPLE_ID=MMETSP1450 /ASSEMBLY_ACC=CAM_ASM_001115 /LENGTH=412 /DNA_ID=CAMNT_0044035081 /DNA_START=49 /DNA_END=1284 /DNA_ORIENTATION=+